MRTKLTPEEREIRNQQIKEYQKQYRERNKHRLSEYYAKYKKDNDEHLLLYRAEYYQQNIQEMATRSKQYRSTIDGKFASYKSSAKFRKIPFEIDCYHFETLWQKPCVYCGSLIDTIGIDRVNNTLGYTPSNIVPCCAICNRMKLTATLDKFYSQVKNIVTHDITSTFTHTFKPNTGYSKYKRDAVKRNLVFEIDLTQFKQITAHSCVYCGLIGSMGIDRIDSLKGYIMENVVPCCSTCNRMKLDHTLNTFIDHVNKIYNHMNLDKVATWNH